jgi:copper transport protein
MVAASVPLSTPALWITGVERALMLGGLTVAFGGLAGRGLARQYKGPRPGPLPPPWALRACVVGLVASAALLVTALAGPGVAKSLAQPPVAGLGAAATAPIALGEMVCFALAALLLRLRQPGPSVIPLAGVVLAEGIRAHPEGIIPVAGALITFCHLLPAILWAGMLLYALRTAHAWRGYPAAAQGIMRLYATAAAWLFAIVLVTGVVSALVLVPIGSLLTTDYGLFVIAKAVVVGTAALLAVAGRLKLRGQPDPGDRPALVTRLEVGALAAALVITGILTVLTPPARPI